MKQGSSVSKVVSQNVDTTIASSDIVLIYAQRLANIGVEIGNILEKATEVKDRFTYNDYYWGKAHNDIIFYYTTLCADLMQLQNLYYWAAEAAQQAYESMFDMDRLLSLILYGIIASNESGKETTQDDTAGLPQNEYRPVEGHQNRTTL